MEEKEIWKKYRRKYNLRRLFSAGFKKVFKKSAPFAIPRRIKKRMIDADETNRLIREIIEKGEPALISRIGSVESMCTAEAIGINLNALNCFSKMAIDTIHFNAGVFPKTNEMALRFAEISKEAIANVDLIGYWRTFMQDYFIERFAQKNLSITRLGDLEPYFCDTPWSVALKGKKVLVIHPFTNTIEAQYKKRELLFENKDVLPEFELRTIKAVQSIAGQGNDRFKDWEEALNNMYDEAMKIDFDVAIIGCGAYGMPLGSKIKNSGKIAIHLGGATQILFGIRGARWDDQDKFVKLFNEHWTRPLECEKPKNAERVEGGCYW